MGSNNQNEVGYSGFGFVVPAAAAAASRERVVDAFHGVHARQHSTVRKYMYSMCHVLLLHHPPRILSPAPCDEVPPCTPY